MLQDHLKKYEGKFTGLTEEEKDELAEMVGEMFLLGLNYGLDQAKGMKPMKTLEEILKQEPVFLNCFEDKENVLNEFSEDIKDHGNTNILFASYGCDNYEGEAFVLFEKEGKLYEVNGSHCSCYGLEDQWEPEEVLLEELEHRLLSGTFGENAWSDNIFKEDLCEFLGVEYKKNKDY
jgi:hypothetical protein